MGGYIGPNGVRITKAGIKRFDTRDKLLHSVDAGFPIAGSILIPALSGGGGEGGKNLTQVWDLGPAPPNGSFPYGSVKMDLAGNANGLPFDRWHTVMGGSILWVMDGEPGMAEYVGDNGYLAQWDDYHFRVNAGRVEMVRRVFIYNSTGVYTILIHRITYKLRCGHFT